MKTYYVRRDGRWLVLRGVFAYPSWIENLSAAQQMTAAKAQQCCEAFGDEMVPADVAMHDVKIPQRAGDVGVATSAEAIRSVWEHAGYFAGWSGGTD